MSDSIAQFDCSDSSGNTSVVVYAESSGYSVFPPQSAQAFLGYCAARNTAGQAAPVFTKCSSDIAHGGFDCVTENCQINVFQNGAICSAGESSFVAYAESENFVAFSAADSQQLNSYCNVSFQNQTQ